MKKKHCFLLIIVIIMIIVMWIFWSNVALELTSISIEHNSIPKELDGFKIVQISDLHNYEFGKNNKKLIEMVKQENPDIITLTGDFVDAIKQNKEIALHFAEESAKIAPTFYVTGNHESGMQGYNEFMDNLRNVGVKVLDNKLIEFSYNNTYVNIVGILDPSDGFWGYNYIEVNENRLDEVLKEQKDYYTILLAHRPEYYGVYMQYNIDLVLSGHTHGGQFRLPFVGGIIGHNYELFPKYDSGLFKESKTYMVVSRGLGSSNSMPIRINNRPEVVSISLHSIS